MSFLEALGHPYVGEVIVGVDKGVTHIDEYRAGHVDGFGTKSTCPFTGEPRTIIRRTRIGVPDEVRPVAKRPDLSPIVEEHVMVRRPDENGVLRWVEEVRTVPRDPTMLRAQPELNTQLPEQQLPQPPQTSGEEAPRQPQQLVETRQ